MRVVVSTLILVASLLGFGFGSGLDLPLPCQAQSPLLGAGELIRELNLAAGAMRTYRKTHENFPALQPDLDDALRAMFKAVSFTPADTAIVPQSLGNFRTYYQFAIAMDPSIRSLPVINGQYKPPNSWHAPANTIVIFSDGQNQFAAWVAGQDGKPIDDPTTHVPLIILETIDPQAEADTKS
ncbi:hypothetical protein BH10CYA1_BH10CYA1_47660 [soil metagenome]